MRFPENGEPYKGTWVAPRDISAEQLREVDNALSRMKRSMLGGQSADIHKGLGRLAAHFPNSNSDDQWRVVFNDYAVELSEYPEDIVLEAMRLYKRQGRFFPKLSELVKLVEPLVVERRAHITRAEILLNRKPEQKVAEHVKDPRVADGLTKLVAKLKGQTGEFEWRE